MVLRRLLIAIALFLFTWFITGTLWDRLPKSSSVTEVSYPAVGGGCPHLLYDQNGKGYEANNLMVRYSGPAPLFAISPEVLGLTDPTCLDYPSRIDPSLAIMGQAIYPVSIFAEFESEALKAGESYPFRAVAILGKYFSEGPSWQAAIRPNELVDITFKLDATNFEYSPSNQETKKVPFGFDFPAEQTWSIAPIERASGEQFIMVTIEGDTVNAAAVVTIDVRDPLGIQPSSLALVSAVGVTIAYLLSQIKTIVDIRSQFRKSNEEK